MTIEEKAALLFHDMIVMGTDGQLSPAIDRFGLLSNHDQIHQKGMTHFNLLGPVNDARAAAKWHNNLQREARNTRLGIPVTLSTDPRNHFTDNLGTGFKAGVFSEWPEPVGLAALRSPALVQQFADIARQEYLAVGLRVSLHPQIDLATEPRWARLAAGFGEDADLTSELVAAYIRGFQPPANDDTNPSENLHRLSVATMTKHFPGGGPQKDGEDPHFAYGREQIYPGGNMEYHLRPFRAAIAAGTAEIMPYYGMPVGTQYAEEGFAFNKAIITDLLRKELGFDGIVCTDWALVKDREFLGEPMPARAWGVEHLSDEERLQRLIEAGCDQIGGESCPELLVSLVRGDKGVSEARLDESVRRLLRQKFLLGLFDDPFVDEDKAAEIVGNERFVALGNEIQRRSYTLLTNKANVLPLSTRSKEAKYYVEGIPEAVLQARGIQTVSDPREADIALLRLHAPYEKRPGAFEAMFHAGSLEYTPKEKARQAAIYSAVPVTIVDIHADRPPVVPEIAEAASAVLLNYGATADAFLDVAFGLFRPEGKLPFDLPSSQAAVVQSRSDVPYDTLDPLFRFGHGLVYE
jgi:beta-glucosidase